jgi:hypothetical protein
MVKPATLQDQNAMQLYNFYRETMYSIRALSFFLIEVIDIAIKWL